VRLQFHSRPAPARAPARMAGLKRAVALCETSARATTSWTCSVTGGPSILPVRPTRAASAWARAGTSLGTGSSGGLSALKGLLHLPGLGLHVAQVRRQAARGVTSGLSGCFHEGLIGQVLLTGDPVALCGSLIGPILRCLVGQPARALASGFVAVPCPLCSAD